MGASTRFLHDFSNNALSELSAFLKFSFTIRGAQDDHLFPYAFVLWSRDSTKVSLGLCSQGRRLYVLLRGDEPMIVLDTQLDWRFAKNVRIWTTVTYKQ